MNKTSPFIQATKLYLRAVRSIELTQYKRAKKDEREKITARNKELNKLFNLDKILININKIYKRIGLK